MRNQVKLSNKEAESLFADKFLIANSDGSIWTADCAEIYSSHQPEYDSVAKDWTVLECKFPWVRGFGKKKVRFTNLQQTNYTRENFSNSFGSAFKTDPLNLHSREIENSLMAKD